MVDLIVDVIDLKERSVGFFYAQVKATGRPAHHSGQRMPVKIKQVKYTALTSLPIPAYLIAVDASAERAYIVAADRPRQLAPTSVTTRYPLACDDVRATLFREVVGYWSGARRRLKRSWFQDD